MFRQLKHVVDTLVVFENLLVLEASFFEQLANIIEQAYRQKLINSDTCMNETVHRMKYEPSGFEPVS